MLTAVIIGLWATIALGGVLSSPRWGFVAVGGAIIVPPFYSWFVSDFYYEALLDLHEEARKVRTTTVLAQRVSDWHRHF